MATGVTDDDFERINRYLARPHHARDADDLIPTTEETD